jgi:hypothetical protein
MEGRDEEVQPQLLSDDQVIVACLLVIVQELLSSMKEHLYIRQKMACGKSST